MPAVSRRPGHVFRLDGARGPSGTRSTACRTAARSRSKIGPAWTERGRPPAGYFTKRTAEAWLREVLDEARRGTLPGMVRTGATFADAAAEFLRYVADDRATASRQRCATTARSSTRTSCPRSAPSASRTSRRRRSRRGMRVASRDGSRLSNRTKNKLLVVLHGVFRRAQKVCGLPLNPVAEHREATAQRSSGDIDVFSPRRSWRWCARPATSRTRRSTSPRRSPACAAASCRVAVARRRLRRLGDPRAGELRGRQL